MQRRLEPEAKREAILLSQQAPSCLECQKCNLQRIVRMISLSLNTFIWSYLGIRKYSKLVFEKQTNSSRMYMYISGQQLIILCSTKTKRVTVGYDTLSEINSLELSHHYDGSL